MNLVFERMLYKMSLIHNTHSNCKQIQAKKVIPNSYFDTWIHTQIFAILNFLIHMILTVCVKWDTSERENEKKNSNDHIRIVRNRICVCL